MVFTVDESQPIAKVLSLGGLGAVADYCGQHGENSIDLYKWKIRMDMGGLFQVMYQVMTVGIDSHLVCKL